MIAAKCNGCGRIGCDGNNMLCIPHNLNINPYSIEQQVKEQIQYFKRQLLKLDKYQPTFEGLMEESEEYGEYIKLEDILNLFSAKK